MSTLRPGCQRNKGPQIRNPTRGMHVVNLPSIREKGKLFPSRVFRSRRPTTPMPSTLPLSMCGENLLADRNHATFNKNGALVIENPQQLSHILGCKRDDARPLNRTVSLTRGGSSRIFGWSEPHHQKPRGTHLINTAYFRILSRDK